MKKIYRGIICMSVGSFLAIVVFVGVLQLGYGLWEETEQVLSPQVEVLIRSRRNEWYSWIMSCGHDTEFTIIRKGNLPQTQRISASYDDCGYMWRVKLINKYVVFETNYIVFRETEAGIKMIDFGRINQKDESILLALLPDNSQGVGFQIKIFTALVQQSLQPRKAIEQMDAMIMASRKQKSETTSYYCAHRCLLPPLPPRIMKICIQKPPIGASCTF